VNVKRNIVLSRRTGNIGRNNMAKNKVVFGIYSTRVGAESAVDALKADGFRSTDISVLMPEKVSTTEFAHEKHTKAPADAGKGAGSGIVIGGALGWLVGIGALAIPGLGPFVAAGPLMAALAGAGVGGTVGGIAGALIGMGIPEYEAKRYEGRVNKGGILLSVHSDSLEWAKRAEEILKRTGAEDISTTEEAKAEDTAPPHSAEEVPASEY
jgi:hypothetical protein